MQQARQEISAGRSNSSKIRRFTGSNIVLLLALCGIFISCYLLYHHVSVQHNFQNGPSFCTWNSQFDCDAVAASKYSEFFGLPVASWGLLYYFLLLFFASFSRDLPNYSASRYNNALFALVVLGLVPTIAMALISFFVIQKICVVCSSLYLLNLFLLLVALGGVRRNGAKILTAVKGGLIDIVRFATALCRPNDPAATLSQVAWVACAFALFSVALVPNFLLVDVLTPMAPQHGAKDFTEELVQEWRRSPRYEIPVNLDPASADRDFALGNVDAPVRIISFSDFECPHCRKASGMLESLAREFPLRLVFKNFPLDRSCNDLLERDIHKSACNAAALARCAGKFGDEKFWEMHDAIFKYEALDDEILSTLPAKLGLDPAQIQQCLDDPAVVRRVQSDIEQGQNVHIQATPAVFIDGRLVKNPTLEVMRQILKTNSRR